MSQGGLGNLSAEQQEAVIQNVRMQSQMQAQQEIITRVTEKCFAVCVTSPGSTLSNKEQVCLAQCFDRFMDTMQVVVRAMSDASNNR